MTKNISMTQLNIKCSYQKKGSYEKEKTKYINKKFRPFINSHILDKYVNN